MRLEQGGGGGGGGSLDKPESNNDQIDGATMKTAKKCEYAHHSRGCDHHVN